jgi:putative membrane protein
MEDPMKRTRVLYVALVAVGLAGCSNTERSTTPESQPQAERGVGGGGAGANLKGDGEFLHDMATKHIAEIALSRMALEKSVRPDVKAFAQMMIQDHGASDARLKSVVSAQQMAWPTELDEDARETADDLAKQQGPEFDRDYAKAMVEGHQNLAAKLESRLDVTSLAEWKTAVAGRTQHKAMPEPKAEMADVQVRPNHSSDATTTKVNQWAAETYPVVQKHLDTASTLENAIKAAGDRPKTSTP